MGRVRTFFDDPSVGLLFITLFAINPVFSRSRPLFSPCYRTLAAALLSLLLSLLLVLPSLSLAVSLSLSPAPADGLYTVDVVAVCTSNGLVLKARREREREMTCFSKDLECKYSEFEDLECEYRPGV